MRRLIFALLLVVAEPARAELPACDCNRLPAHMIRAVDGDTVVVRVTLPLDVERTITVRVLGIDTPEMVGAQQVEARVAKLALEGWFARPGGKTIETKGTDKYGRVLGTFRDVKGESLAAELLRLRLAQPYPAPKPAK